jgi:hypothetical protein
MTDRRKPIRSKDVPLGETNPGKPLWNKIKITKEKKRNDYSTSELVGVGTL